MASVALPSVAFATELEVTHWWTSGGEAAAVAEFAKAFDATGNTWVTGPSPVRRLRAPDHGQPHHGRRPDGGHAVQPRPPGRGTGGFGPVARPDGVAEKEGWAQIVNPPSLLESCTLDGKIYCVPVNIHSWQWLWLSNKAFADAGVPVPTNWNEFVAAAPALEAKGIVPLAMGQQTWQNAGAFNVLMVAVAGRTCSARSTRTRTLRLRAGRDRAGIPGHRRRAPDGREFQGADWNQPPTWSSTGQAAGRSWATGRRRIPDRRSGRGQGLYLPSRPRPERGDLDRRRRPSYFPVLSDPEKSAAQEVLASTMMAPATQVAFNLRRARCRCAVTSTCRPRTTA